MKLYDGKLFWPTTTNTKEFKSLDTDVYCDITIIGGGMSGILCGYYLSIAGYKVVLIEKDKLGTGSSSANTGLLQFSSDILLSELSKEIGEKDAYLFYEMCYKAMEDFKNLPEDILKASDFYSRDSIYYASKHNDVNKILAEYVALKKHNFPVEYLNSKQLSKRYNIEKYAALLTGGDGEINPYKFIHAIAETKNSNLAVYENTKANNINCSQKEIVVSCDKAKITSNYIILATGYKGNDYPQIKKGKLNRTFAIATNKLDKLPWNDKSLIWETARPYLYARMTDDNRIIAGGLDQEISTIVDDEYYIFLKGQEILGQLKKAIPSLDANVEYAWNAIFGESLDNLPFIGVDPKDKRCFYCLGFGGNGTVYSMAGAKIIKDLIENKSNPYAHLVKLDR